MGREAFWFATGVATTLAALAVAAIAALATSVIRHAAGAGSRRSASESLRDFGVPGTGVETPDHWHWYCLYRTNRYELYALDPSRRALGEPCCHGPLPSGAIVVALFPAADYDSARDTARSYLAGRQQREAELRERAIEEANRRDREESLRVQERRAAAVHAPEHVPKNPTSRFGTLRAAVEHAVALASSGRDFIVDFLDTPLQIVPPSFLGDRREGLMIYLPLDPGQFEWTTEQFLSSSVARLFRRGETEDRVPFYTLRCGMDIDLACHALAAILVEVFEHPRVGLDVETAAEVIDEGPARTTAAKPVKPAGVSGDDLE